MNYYILVDYDNLSFQYKRNGLTYIAEKIITQLTKANIQSTRVSIRLYGGWYEKDKTTKLAQDLTTEINSTFPTSGSLKDGESIIINIELANSLLIKPQILLYHTYRKNGIPHGLNCKHPVNAGCFKDNCPIKKVHDFMDKNKCSECNHVKPEELFYRNEQKLVDSMVTSDLIYLSQEGNNISLVSSDDDFWPAILTAITMGRNIIQFHTQGTGANKLYAETINSLYTQKILR